MSRTFRKRKGRACFGNTLEQSLWDHVNDSELHYFDLADLDEVVMYYCSINWQLYRIKFSPTSKEGIKRAALYHSDAYTHECKEPGPSDWKNLTTHRPYRRKYKEQCRKTLYDDDFEVVLEKIVYPYWT